MSLFGQWGAGLTPVNLNEAVTEAKEYWGALFSHITFVANLTEASSMIAVNRRRLTQSLGNLVLNSSHAIGEAPGNITLTITNESLTEAIPGRRGLIQPGQYVVLRVTDDGGGIPEALLPNALSKPFTTKGLGGSGIGLMSLAEFVQESEGNITVESRVGVGTSFSLYFPALPPP